MLQEYFNNTIEQSFLKSLLSAVQLPNYKIIRDNDLIFKDYFYIYEGDIIKCTKTGYINPQNSVIGVIQVGDQISPSQAEFEIMKQKNLFVLHIIPLNCTKGLVITFVVCVI